MLKSKAGAALLIGLLSATSQADSISYYLNQSNKLDDGVNYLLVTISDERKEGVIDFTVVALQPLIELAGRNFGIEAFGFNVIGGVGAEAKKVKLLPDDWRARNVGRMDGFGLFDITVEAGKKGKGHHDDKHKDDDKHKGKGHDDHGKGYGYGHGGYGYGHGGGDAQQPLTFSIKGVTFDDIFSYVDLSTGRAPEGWSLFSARVTGLNLGNCNGDSDKKGPSSFKSGGSGGYGEHCGRSAYFGGGPVVPAPPAIWLLGTALAGLVVRRLRSTNRSNNRAVAIA